MNDIIIHISDLHITDSSGQFAPVNTNTFLTSGNADRNNTFLDLFIAQIKKLGYKRCFLIVTGDITNIAEECEFEVAITVFNKILRDLNITKDNVLLIPGDHDIHRDTIKDELRKNRSLNFKGHELHEAKYRNFNLLYKSIKEINFNHEKLIFDKLEIDDFIIAGVNSNYNVSQNPANGYLPLSQFSEELKELRNIYKDKNLALAFHHNISGGYEDKQSGQWDLDNRKDLLTYFQSNEVRCVFHGNEHTPRSYQLDNTGIYVSDTGAFTSISNPQGSFKIYEAVNVDGNFRIKNHVYDHRNTNSVQEPTLGDWNPVIPENVTGELSYFNIIEKKELKIEEPIDLPERKNVDIVVEETYLEAPVFYKKLSEQNKLYQIIKDKKLYHSGHFHWSESSRAHNWIDVSKLLEDKDDLYFAKSIIVDVIETFSLHEKCDLMIGLGAEGSIIASKASIKFQMPYTSLPYSYRYKESHKYETRLNFDNIDGKYKNVIIITDVVNDGRTIRQLIANNEKDFFKTVEKVVVISLFYTGHEKMNTDILNFEKLPKDFDRSKDFEVNKIEYYAIKSLRVEKCPYKDDFREKCFIYKDDLSCVNLFYEEKK